jgi:hypothetical protein
MDRFERRDDRAEGVLEGVVCAQAVRRVVCATITLNRALDRRFGALQLPVLFGVAVGGRPWFDEACARFPMQPV